MTGWIMKTAVANGTFYTISGLFHGAFSEANNRRTGQPAGQMALHMYRVRVQAKGGPGKYRSSALHWLACLLAISGTCVLQFRQTLFQSLNLCFKGRQERLLSLEILFWHQGQAL